MASEKNFWKTEHIALYKVTKVCLNGEYIALN